MIIATDRAFIPSSTAATRYLTVQVQAPASTHQSQRAPVNVALVLDRSGSMDGRKIEMARAAVEHAIKLLDARDHLALVVYDTEVGVVLESTAATPEAKALALKRLASIGARGSTDLCAGWSAGADQIERFVTAKDDAGPARVLLLTDGLANHGLIDHDELARLAARFRASGIVTSTFGLGADFDETLLTRLATEGGGHFYFIESPRQIPDLLASELGETLDIVAPGAEFVVVGGPDVQIAVLNDFPFEAKPDGLHVQLGDLVGGQELKLVVALRWQPRAERMPATASCRLVDRAGKLFPQPMLVEWTTVDTETNAAQPVNASVLVAVAEQMVARAQARALEANRKHRLEEAAEILSRAIGELRALGTGIQGIDVLIAQLEDDKPQFERVMETMDAKARHFVSYNQARGRDSEGKARRRA
jgi:Ca-activated chloride channel family protein